MTPEYAGLLNKSLNMYCENCGSCCPKTGCNTASKTITKYVFLPDRNIVTTLGINIIEK
jgi:hypothetical protein